MVKKNFAAEAERDANTNTRAPKFSVHETRTRGTSRLGGAVVIDLQRLEPDAGQVRSAMDLASNEMRELAESIKIHGVLQPLTVFYKRDSDVYRIISGERRYHAAITAGIREVPCLVRECPPSEAERTQLQLIENLHRKDMNPLDEATAYQALSKDHGLTLAQIAAQVGKSKSYISKSVRLCSLAEDIKADLTAPQNERPKLAFEHLQEIARQKTTNAQRELYERVRDNALSVKEMRHEAKRNKQGAGQRGKRAMHRFSDPNGHFSVVVRFKKAEVEQSDVRNALEAALTALEHRQI